MPAGSPDYLTLLVGPIGSLFLPRYGLIVLDGSAVLDRLVGPVVVRYVDLGDTKNIVTVYVVQYRRTTGVTITDSHGLTFLSLVI